MGPHIGIVPAARPDAPAVTYEWWSCGSAP